VRTSTHGTRAFTPTVRAPAIDGRANTKRSPLAPQGEGSGVRTPALLRQHPFSGGSGVVRLQRHQMDQRLRDAA
jgi:hypothetical protein